MFAKACEKVYADLGWIQKHTQDRLFCETYQDAFEYGRVWEDVSEPTKANINKCRVVFFKSGNSYPFISQSSLLLPSTHIGCTLISRQETPCTIIHISGGKHN